MKRIPQSTTPIVLLKVYLSSDHVSAATGKTVVVTLSKNGGAFANPSAGATNATEIANGWYYVTLSATDAGTLGDMVVRGTCSGCDDAERICDVVNANNGGMATLPNTACTSNASLLTSGVGADQIHVSGNGGLFIANNGITSSSVAGNSFTSSMFATSFFDAILTNHAGTATAATSTTITLQNTASGVDGYYVGQQIRIKANTGAQQVRTITGYVGGTFVATIDRAWATTPDSTSTYAVIGDDAPALNSSLQVGASSTGGTVTVGTNNDKTGYSLTQTFPSNFSSLAITGGGAVTAGTVSDKTGYSLTQSFPTNFSSLAITAGGAVTAGTVSDKTGYTVSTVSDKTGYSLSSSQTFSTTGAVGSVTNKVTPVDADGLTYISIMELLIAMAASPVSSYTDNGNGTATIALKKQDGTTTKYTVTFNTTTTARSASTIS